MRKLFLLIFIAAGFSGFAQKEKDPWDAYFFQHHQKQNYYDSILKKDLYATDTTSFKDSVVTSFFSKNGQLLQRMKQYIKDDGCIYYTHNDYCNNKGLVVYSKHFQEQCPKPVLVDPDNRFFSIEYHDRYEYDTAERVILHVYNISMPRTFRETFTYDQSGKVTKTRKVILETEFWD